MICFYNTFEGYTYLTASREIPSLMFPVPHIIRQVCSQMYTRIALPEYRESYFSIILPK